MENTTSKICNSDKWKMLWLCLSSTVWHLRNLLFPLYWPPALESLPCALDFHLLCNYIIQILCSAFDYFSSLAKDSPKLVLLLFLFPQVWGIYWKKSPAGEVETSTKGRASLTCEGSQRGWDSSCRSQILHRKSPQGLVRLSPVLLPYPPHK